MLRNFPTSYTRSFVVQLLDQQGFAGCYDLVYVPLDFSTLSAFGYSFVNFVCPAEAVRCHAHFQGFRAWSCDSNCVAEVSWSEGSQGVMSHVERYRNSPVMHRTVPDEFKPALFCMGCRVCFPAPTRTIKAPKMRRR